MGRCKRCRKHTWFSANYIAPSAIHSSGRTGFFLEWEVGVGVGTWELQTGWEKAFPTPTQMVKVGVGVGVVPRWESGKWESVNVFTPRGRPIYTSHFPPSRIVRAIVKKIHIIMIS